MLAEDDCKNSGRISAVAHCPSEPTRFLVLCHRSRRGEYWVSLDAHWALREIAAAHRLTLSQVAAEILERGLRERAETAGRRGAGDPPAAGSGAYASRLSFKDPLSYSS
ncbi:MAG TPA: hypothetical protein VEW91_01835 [bacterium]|nr:hypothetical protein [bacterium]